MREQRKMVRLARGSELASGKLAFIARCAPDRAVSVTDRRFAREACVLLRPTSRIGRSLFHRGTDAGLDDRFAASLPKPCAGRRLDCARPALAAIASRATNAFHSRPLS